MQATIEIKESEYDDRDLQPYTGLFGRVKFREVYLGKKKLYTVHLTLIPSEEEKAIILKYKLDELAVETHPKFTDEDIAKQEDRYRAMGMTDEEMNCGIRQGLDEMRQTKDQTLLSHYFNNPYTKAFHLRQDAHMYADKLEKEVLPLIKTQIDYYRVEAVRQDKRNITL